TATASAVSETGKVTLTVTSRGTAPKRGNKDAIPERSSAQRPVTRMTLLRRLVEGSEDRGEIVVARHEAGASNEAGMLQWQTQFEVSKTDFEAPDTLWSVYVEEVERMRPATYQDEPRPATADDK